MKDLFCDINGKISSKRVFGALAFVVGCVLAFVTKEASLMWPCFTMAGGLFGFSVGEKIKGND